MTAQAPAGVRPRRAAVGTVPRAALLGVLLAAVVLLVLRELVPPSEHAHAGTATWAGALARLLTHVTAVLTVGWLALAALVLDRSGGPLSAYQLRCLSPVAVLAAAWCAVAGAAAGLAVWQSGQDGDGVLARAGEQSGLLVAAAAALAVAFAAPALRSADEANACLLLAVCGLVLPVVVGHDGSPAERVAVVAHVAAAAMWIGGLSALVALSRRAPEVVAAALKRFSGLALLCVVVLAGSGSVAALASLADLDDLTGTGFGRLLLLKAGLLAVGCVLGLVHRRSVLAGLDARGVTATFHRLAAGEVVLLVTVLGVAVALGQAAPG